jgi:predicted hotdog family 3-hydroxylacyl-ACP dehydratase
MCLLERVLEWDAERLVAETTSHRCEDNPLRRDGVLVAVHALEYAAQAMAVHGGLRAAEQGEALPGGFLAAGRRIGLHVRRLDELPGLLRVEVQEQFRQGGNLIYSFRVAAGDRPVAEGEATVLARGE